MANVLHSSLTTTDLHEPKGAAAATSGQVYVANGAGSGVWTTPDPVVFMQKHIAGLTWSNAADATNDITIATGTCRDTTNTEDMTLSAAITKQLDVNWVVGDNQGGLDTGAVANTTYHIWLIKRPDTGVVDALFSTSATAPTMPGGGAYTKKRRIGSFMRVGGVNQPVFVTEMGGGSIRVDLTANTTTTSLSVTTTQGNKTVTGLPSGVAYMAHITAGNPSTGTVWLGSPNVTSNMTYYTTDSTDTSNKSLSILTNTSAQISADASASPTQIILLHGWTDFRRD